MYFELIVEIQHCSQTTLFLSLSEWRGEGPKLNKILIKVTVTKKPFKKLLKKISRISKKDFAISIKWYVFESVFESFLRFLSPEYYNELFYLI